jgi:uncharacterized phage protein (TIGR01671 family)
MLPDVSTGTIRVFTENGSYLTDECDFMQFTGLLDKNGKEIYEGDVVRVSNTAKPFEIIFTDGSFVGKCEKPTNSIDLRIFELDEPRRTIFEVLGNSFENPELLNQPLN